MDLMQSFGVLRKRVKLTITLLLLTVVATVGAYVALPSSYQSVGDVVLLTSQAQTSTFGNPYLSFDQALDLTGDLLCVQVTGQATQKSLANAGHTGSYTAAVQSQTGAPIIEITATAKNQGVAQGTLTAVMAQLNTELTNLQADVQPQNRIRSSVLLMSPNATKKSSSKTKILVIVFAIGLILTFVIPQTVERRSVERRRRAVDASSAPRRQEDQEGRAYEEQASLANQSPHVPQEETPQPGTNPQPGVNVGWDRDSNKDYVAPRAE